MSLRLLTVIILCLIAEFVWAQESELPFLSDRAWDEAFAELMAMSEEELTDDQWADMYEQLSDLAEHPIDLNHADETVLVRLPFLNDQQIEDIAYHVYRYGGFRSFGELQLVPSLDHPRRLLLQQFTTISYEDEDKEQTLSFGKLLKYSKQEVFAQAHIPTYSRRGDNIVRKKNGTLQGYMGYPVSHSVSWQIRNGDRFKMGLSGSQDPGEPFGSYGNSLGYDHYSYYFMLRQPVRGVSCVALGNYKIRSGLGLVINNSFGFGKQQSLSTLWRSGDVLSANTSKASANFLQGVAVTLTPLPRVSFTAFASFTPRDGTPLGTDSISAFNTTGYHRTMTELQRKHNLTETLLGGALAWRRRGLHLGMTAVYTHLTKYLAPDKRQMYRRYYPTGQDFANVGVNYGYRRSRFMFTGETAVDADLHLATLNAAQIRLSSVLDMSLVQRYYSMRYNALKANTFGNNRMAQNESGCYLSLNYNPSRRFVFTTYADYAYYPWARYQVSRDSYGAEAYTQASYTGAAWNWSIRYRYRLRQQDDATKKHLMDKHQHSLRLMGGYKSSVWSESISFYLANQTFDAKSSGFAISQRVDVKPLRWLQTTVQVARFKTDDYDSRVYVSERPLLRSLTSESFYGNGLRWSAFVRADIGRWAFLGRLSSTHYYDRTVISSGLNEIQGSTKTDIYCQIWFRF